STLHFLRRTETLRRYAPRTRHLQASWSIRRLTTRHRAPWARSSCGWWFAMAAAEWAGSAVPHACNDFWTSSFSTRRPPPVPRRIGALSAILVANKRCGFMTSTQQLIQYFAWCLPPECLSRPSVHLVSYEVEVFSVVLSEVLAFGKVLTKQSVGIFVAASLPGTVRIAEKDTDPRVHSELGMLRHLLPAIPGK